MQSNKPNVYQQGDANFLSQVTNSQEDQDFINNNSIFLAVLLEQYFIF